MSLNPASRFSVDWTSLSPSGGAEPCSTTTTAPWTSRGLLVPGLDDVSALQQCVDARDAKHTTAVQIFTQASPSVFNESCWPTWTGRSLRRELRVSPSCRRCREPQRRGNCHPVAGPPAAAGGGGFGSRSWRSRIISSSTGSRHTLGAGIHVELFRYHAQGVRGKFGQWRFSSLDALANGNASSYSSRKISEPPGTRSWRAAERVLQRRVAHPRRLSLTLGLRADALKFFRSPGVQPRCRLQSSSAGRATTRKPACSGRRGLDSGGSLSLMTARAFAEEPESSSVRHRSAGCSGQFARMAQACER